MLYYLNNCHNLDHAKIYGGDAIFDLYAHGPDDKAARRLRVGDTCVVASRVGKENFAFAWYRITGTKLVPDGKLSHIWVIDGELERRVVLPKVNALDHSVYSRFFNKLGHFNQWSVIEAA